MTHLVNHMSHFPMGSGAARLHTTVQEHHDLPEYVEEDLKPEIFSAPNVQVVYKRDAKFSLIYSLIYFV